MWLSTRRAHGWSAAGAGFACAALWACGSPPPVALTDTRPAETEAVPAVVDSADSENQPGAPRLVVLGDSLTAGLGIDPDQAFPARLQERIDSNGYDLVVVDAGVSGDTTAGAMRRLEWALEGDVRLLIVALGGNDGLRGLPVEQMKGNLKGIITTAEARGVAVLLAGMEAPPNYGQAYADAFRNVFFDLAREHDVPLVPFLLEGVAGETDLNQPDGIHPNAQGAERVAAHLWVTVESMVRQVVEATGQERPLERND